MPLGDFEACVLRTIAANRNPDSFVGGGTVLHATADSPRYSQDLDIFHDAPAALARAVEFDCASLRSTGFGVEMVGRAVASFQRAIVTQGGEQTKVEWVQDSAFRFFAVEPDLQLGWRLNFWDAATNKVLAMAGRQKLRDFLDCLYLHQRYLHLGALVWAAAGKDPGLTPEFILDWALRGNQFRPEDLAEVKLGAPIDLVQTKQAWVTAVREARDLVSQLPAAHLGCLYLGRDGQPQVPDPRSVEFATQRRHYGSLGGVVAQIVASDAEPLGSRAD